MTAQNSPAKDASEMRVVTEAEDSPWRNDEKSEFNGKGSSSVYGVDQGTEVTRTQRTLERGYGRTIKIPDLNRSRSLW